MDLPGNKPGPYCPAYHKSSDRTLCKVRGCKFYQNHVVTESASIRDDPTIDYDDSLNAVSIKKPVVILGNIRYEIGEACEWHCVRYDEPSHLETLAWE